MTVTDKDLGFKNVVKSFNKMDRTVIKAGVINVRAEYPKGKRPVATVAHVHDVTKILGQVTEQFADELDKLFSKAFDRMIKGVRPEVAFLPIAYFIKKKYRAEIKKKGLVDTGLLVESILGAVFKNGKRLSGDKY